MSRSLRLLLVEDSPEDAELVVREIEASGYHVEWARVQTAVDLRAALRSPWDVVVSDYAMPGFSGPAALAILRAHDPHTPFIMVSGTIGEDTAVAALKAGANDFLVKDRLARLVPAVERELRESAARSEHQRLEEQLRQSQKMESIGRLAGGIAHDLNNILTTIVGYTEMSLEQIGLDKPLGGDLLEIRKAADRATELTRQLLAFSRKQTLKVVPLAINDVITNAYGMLRRLISEDVKFDLALAPDLPLVAADPVQLEQVLLNLAANANDAMPGGGVLRIETARAMPDDARPLTGDAGAGMRYVRLAVRDSGVGVPAEVADRIFEPFFTTKEPGKGTGLGLATVHGIVKQLGGHITLESEPGRGASFVMLLPAPEGLAERPAPSTSKAHTPVAAGPSVVLVVEDEPPVRTLVARILARHGYTVLEAASAGEALALAADHGGPIHLVLSDVVMPDVGGAELVRRLQASRPGVRALFMSGYTGEAAISRGSVDPDAQLLEKPFSARDLLETVGGILAS
jgi:signal transduction histidine kinase